MKIQAIKNVYRTKDADSICCFNENIYNAYMKTSTMWCILDDNEEEQIISHGGISISEDTFFRNHFAVIK